MKHTVSLFHNQGANLVTVLPAVLVPACAVLIVGAVTAVACVMRRRQSVAIKSRDGIDMTSAPREEGAGLRDTHIVKLRGYAKFNHPVAYSSPYNSYLGWIG